MAQLKTYDLGTKLTVVAIVAILIGVVAYEVAKDKTPAQPVAQQAEPAVTAQQGATPEKAVTAEKGATPEKAVTPEKVATPEKATAPEQVVTQTDPPASAAATLLPSFDVMRLDPDGAALVAGQVAGGAKVSILVDGAEVATATADDTGKFVVMFNLPSAAAGRLMTMVATLSDGTQVPSPTSVALAATTAPKVADAAASTAKTATQTQTATTQTGTTALAVNDQGAKVLQTDTNVAAEVAANVTIDTIAYPTPEAVQFGGHGTAGALVRLYLDNAPLGDATTVAADGTWNLTQSGIDPKVYTLRADELDASGKVTSRYETPFKRETPQALAAATSAQVATAEPPAPDATAATPAPDVPQTAPSDAASVPVQTDTKAKVPAAQTTTGSDTPAPAADPAAVAAAQTPAPAADTAAVATAQTPAPAANVTPAAPEPSVTVTVQPGFTLWGIAKRQFGSGVLYVQVYEANKDKIKNPDRIYPGQIFTLPKN
jgi:nucleoid-associated protein YgaU